MQNATTMAIITAMGMTAGNTTEKDMNVDIATVMRAATVITESNGITTRHGINIMREESPVVKIITTELSLFMISLNNSNVDGHDNFMMRNSKE